MRIAHLILSRGFAGSERATAEMCNAQCKDHAVLLVLKRGHRSSSGITIRKWLDPAVDVSEVGNWWSRPSVASALEKFQPDVIHAHLRRSTRLLAKIAPSAPTIATLHLTVNGPHFACMDGLIRIAEWQQRDIPADYRGRVFAIPESIIPARRLSREEIRAMRREFGADDRHYVIGGVGRLAHSKGFDILIDAFQRAALPDAKLVIVGEGREYQSLRKRSNGSVILAGFKANVKDYFQCFDLFVSASRREPLGRVMFEALDAGTPVVATTTEGAKEILRAFPDEVDPAPDFDTLVARLQHHYAQRTIKSSVDLRAWHIDTVAAATLQAYHALIDERARAP